MRGKREGGRGAAEPKGEPGPSDEILKLDEAWRAHLHKAETIKAEQNRLSKEFARTRDEGLKDRLREMSDEAKAALELADAVKHELDLLLLEVPNLFHESVPITQTDKDNPVARARGATPDF